MVQKWNFLLCLPCLNVFLTWLPLLYFYIIVKNIFLALLSYHLLWYSSINRVRNQQNIKKVQKMTMDFSILSMWLADSELKPGNSKQDPPVWVTLMCTCCLMFVGGLVFIFSLANYSLAAKPIIQSDAFSHFSMLQMCDYVIFCWILTRLVYE